MNDRDAFPPIAQPPGLLHLVPVVFGDWSSDGHSGTAREYFWSNRDIAGWRSAYQRGCERIGVDFADDVAAEYEDPTISVDDLAALRASGFGDVLEADSPATPEVGERREITFGDFRAMFLYLVRIGDEGLRFAEIENSAHHMEVHPGGYGLFGE